MGSDNISDDGDLVRELFESRSQFEFSLFRISSRICSATEDKRLRHAIVDIESPRDSERNWLRSIIGLLKSHPGNSRLEVREKAFGNSDVHSSIQHELIDTAVHLLLSVDCAKSRYQADGFEVRGHRPVRWKEDESLSDFVRRTFPQQKEIATEMQKLMLNKKAINARQLGKRARIEFRATDTLAEHLLHYSAKDRNIVYLFHNTAYLKARLSQFKEERLDLDVEQSLERGSVPPRLLLETLTSLQDILFPVEDMKSERYLEDLTNKKSYALDKDLQERNGYMGRDLPDCYTYWGERLTHLYELMKNPEPTTRITRWLEHHASDRNTLYVAIVALVLSALFGLLGVIVGIIQAVFAYKALP